MKLSEIARKLGCSVEGPQDTEITGVAGIDHAKPGHVTFLANRRYFPLLKTTQASAVLLQAGITLERVPGASPISALRSENPYLDFARAIEFFYQPPSYAPGIHPTAVIAKSAQVGEGTHIGPYCFVDENAQIGRNAVLHSFVTIYRGAKIGADFCARACRRSRVLRHRGSRHFAKRSGNRRRRPGFREAKRWQLVQNGAIRRGGS
jgi:UDP-3-O-[3-hydroxymyristoyl] glucosamine N-acyltransferase